MKNVLLLSAMLVSIFVIFPSSLRAEQKPEMIAEKMAVKLTRGVANALTSFVELPKQTVLTAQEMGAVGCLVGPLKGVGMTIYRGFIGVTEAVFFMVPQPGYYDPMMDPAYVWQGREPKGDTSKAVGEEK